MRLWAARSCLQGDGYWHLVYNLTMFHEVFSTARPGPRPLLPTLNLSIAREVIDRVGGLDVALRHSHDMEWTTRMRVAGYEPVFWPHGRCANTATIAPLFSRCGRTLRAEATMRGRCACSTRKLWNTPPSCKAAN